MIARMAVLPAAPVSLQDGPPLGIAAESRPNGSGLHA
jgi:hypothetical protein